MLQATLIGIHRSTKATQFNFKLRSQKTNSRHHSGLRNEKSKPSNTIFHTPLCNKQCFPNFLPTKQHTWINIQGFIKWSATTIALTHHQGFWDLHYRNCSHIWKQICNHNLKHINITSKTMVNLNHLLTLIENMIHQNICTTMDSFNTKPGRN